MFYEKKFPSVNRERKKVKITRFAVGRAETNGNFAALIASGGFDCDCSDGSIRPGIGLCDYLLPTGVNPSVPNAATDPPVSFAVLLCKTESGSRTERVLCISKAGLAYVYNDSLGKFVFANMLFDEKPKAVTVYAEDGEAKLAFCNADGVFLYDGTNGFSTVYEGKASDIACAFHERLFFAEAPFTVRYCAPLDVAIWEDSADEGGHIDFPSAEGEIVGLETLKEYVYVFRKRGIFRLDAKGAARDFSAERLAYGGGDIFKASIGACGDKIFFLAEDGFYAFDGNRAERTGLSIFPLPKGQGCAHGACGGKYVLLYPDRDGGKKLLVWDAAAESGYFSTAASDALSDTEGRLLCLSEGKLKQISAEGELPTGGEYLFERENADFGIDGRKFWKEAILKGEGSCIFEATGERETKSFSLVFERGRAKAAPLLTGESFTVRIWLAAGSAVSGMDAEFLLFDRGGRA